MTDLKFTVLGLLGPAGSGKDLVADWFMQKKHFVKIAFADPMKRFVSKAFSIDSDRLWGPSEKRNEMFDVDDSWWFEVIGHFGEASKEIVQDVMGEGIRVEGYLKLHDWLTNLRKTYRDKISTRVILQTLGTEWGREVDGLLWAKYALRMIESLKQGHFYTQTGGIRFREPGEVSAYFGAVISDFRFRNEVELAQTNGAHVIRLRRLSVEKREDEVGIAGHRSEAEQTKLPDDLFHLVLEFPEGIDKVHEIVEAAFESELWTAHSQDTSIKLGLS